MEKLYTPGEVAEELRVDPKTVTRWCKAGRLPYIKTPGGHHRIKESVLMSILDGTLEIE